jgi:hypothetical protein
MLAFFTTRFFGMFRGLAISRILCTILAIMRLPFILVIFRRLSMSPLRLGELLRHLMTSYSVIAKRQEY